MPFCRLLLVIQYRAETKFGIGISEKSFLVDELELKLPGLVVVDWILLAGNDEGNDDGLVVFGGDLKGYSVS